MSPVDPPEHSRDAMSHPDSEWLRDFLTDLTPETETVALSARYFREMAEELLERRQEANQQGMWSDGW